MKEKSQEPEFARRGKLIEVTNPQPEIRKNAEKANDWEYASEAAYLYRMAVLFKDRLLDPVLQTDRGRLPDPVISFENLRNYNTLAAYRLTRNPQGLLYEIIMNTQHYQRVVVMERSCSTGTRLIKGLFIYLPGIRTSSFTTLRPSTITKIPGTGCGRE
jgi:hypothetical protein